MKPARFSVLSCLARFRPSRLAGGALRRALGGVLTLACALSPGLAGAEGCGPAAGGPPVCESGVASTGGGGPDVGAGNPINVITGNKYQREEDMPALPGVLGLEIVRHYNSAYGAPGLRTGPVGRGWRLSYETELLDAGGRIQILQADGGRLIFERDRNDPSLCGTANPANGALVLDRKANGLVEYDWIWANGRRLHFNSAGKLERIAAPSGETVDLLYDGRNALVRVIDPQGRSLSLACLGKSGDRFNGVRYIDSPVGRFGYEYGAVSGEGSRLDERARMANLARVRLPTGYDAQRKAHPLSSRGATTSTVSRVYHYEDRRFPTLLTGISVESGGDQPVLSRISTFGYDVGGRAVLSTHADGVGKITLDTSVGGRTVLTNSLGQKTTYLHAIVGGQHRLLEARGAGCALCGEANVRYGYDRIGRLVEATKLTNGGDPIATVRTELDKLGRVIRVSRSVYRNGKPGPAQWLVRYAYQGAGPQAGVIARPSVVPGREALIRIAYNERGQPLSVTESGWSPAVDGAGAPTPIARTTSYRYALIAGRSLPTRIDGPLPNGKTNSPLDSDITVIEYDHRGEAAPEAPPKPSALARYDARAGMLTAVISPGNLKSTLRYDAAGRIIAISDAENHSTSFQYSPRGQLIATTIAAGITHSTSYDGFDRPVESGHDDGNGYRALARLGYDSAGRNTWTASSLGIVATRRYDTEDRLLEAGTQSSAVKQVQQYAYDPFNRLRAVTDTGGGTRRIGWNALGLPEVVTDALGRATRYRYDGMGHVLEIATAADTMIRFERDALGRTQAVIGSNGATTRYVTDDFGQRLATISADSGMTSRGFDAAGRLIVSTDANGNRAMYEYDVRGRIVRQTVIDASDPVRKQTATAWRYEGPRLVAVDHPEQAERYSYERHGRLAVKTVILKLAGGGWATHVTRYRYDPWGQLAGASLPDGSEIAYRRNGQNQITAIDRQPVRTAWLRWLLPTQSIVKHLERDAVGLKRFTYGNGIEAIYQRSQAGALARIAYRDPDRRGGGDRRGAAPEPPPDIAAPQAVQAAAVEPLPPGALSQPPDAAALLDHRYLWDTQGNLLRDQGTDMVGNYAYDARDRLIATGTASSASPGSARFARYFYDGSGERLLAQEGVADQGDTRTNTVRASYAAASHRWQGTSGEAEGSASARYDAGGQPRAIGKREYVWNPLGTLREVREGRRRLASYRYNHRGQRVGKVTGDEQAHYLYEGGKLAAELDREGRITRQYIYLADQAIALIDTPAGGAVNGGERAPLAQFRADVVAIWSAWFSHRGAIAYLHHNHLGATELVTDATGNPLWRAAYSPFGALMPVSEQGRSGAVTPPFQLKLRLPGQYADQETGLYYNHHRYYDPLRGEYLTPDPLGLRAGINGYAYVNGNPLKYTDPSGLLLFAFDGSGNDKHDSSILSNVAGFQNLYIDRSYYITGVGTKDEATGIAPTALDIGGRLDLAFAYTGKDRITAMIKYLDNYSNTVDDGTAVDIDIVGFSRGAALGRDFASQIVGKSTDGYYHYNDDHGLAQCQKANFRFMGLFDTVLSSHTGEYQLRIPDVFEYVAQAVALNEYRGIAPLTFPLESIIGAPAPGERTRIERGFLGAHSDIGGGFVDGYLAKVALVWMVDQATAAGVSMGNPIRTIIANPVLHDKSSNLLRGADDGGPTANSEDRDVRYADGSVVKQRNATRELMTYADTARYITYKPNPNSQDNISGTVDMKGYLQWLNDNHYDINMTVQ